MKLLILPPDKEKRTNEQRRASVLWDVMMLASQMTIETDIYSDVMSLDLV